MKRLGRRRKIIFSLYVGTTKKKINKRMFDTRILDAICRRYGFETYNIVEEFLEKDEKALEYVLEILFFEIVDLVERKLSDKFEKFVEKYADQYGLQEIDYDDGGVVTITTEKK